MKKEETRQAASTVFEGMTSISAVINGGHRKIERVLIDREKAKKKIATFIIVTFIFYNFGSWCDWTLC